MPAPPEKRASSRKSLFLVLFLLLLLAGLGAGISFTPYGDRIRSAIASLRAPEEPARDVVATLASIENSVKHRDRAALDWNEAREAMPLSDGDKLRTLDDSTAKVTFNEGSELVVEEQSLVTIRAPKKEDQELVADVEIDDGRVRTSIARAADGKERKLQIRSGGKTVAEITTEGAAGFADVSVIVRPDRSSRIVMHRGSGKVVSMGKTITLDQGSAVTADVASSTLGAPEKLKEPDPPAAAFPKAGAKIAALAQGTAGTATVTLGWKPARGAKSYVVQVAKDKAFATIADDAETAETKYGFVATESGQYFWRVLTVDSNLVSGKPGPARSFKVTFAKPKPTPTKRIAKPTPKPTLPPVAKHELEGRVGEPLVVAGSVKKDVLKVSVNGVPAKVDKNGHYEVRLNLPAGKRSIVVEAIHADGSITYEKKDAFIKKAGEP